MTDPVATPRVRVERVAHAAFGVLRLRLTAGATVPAALEAALGFPLPRTPNAVLGRPARALATAPGEWVLIDVAASRAEAALAACPEVLGHYADLTDGCAGFRVTGEDAARLIAGECSLDLSRLAPDACAQSAFAGMPILIDRRAGETGLRLYVDVSLADHLGAWFAALAEDLA